MKQLRFFTFTFPIKVALSMANLPECERFAMLDSPDMRTLFLYLDKHCRNLACFQTWKNRGYMNFPAPDQAMMTYCIIN